MRSLLFFWFLLFSFVSGASESPRFRLHLLSEPSTLSPFRQRNSSSLYFLGQLFCPLQSWDGGSIRSFAADCRMKGPRRAECRLKSGLRFDDGSAVEPKHYVTSFRTFLDPKNPSPRAEILYGLRNARKVLTGAAAPSTLGVREEKGKLVFDLEDDDPGFLLTLANPLLTATVSAEIPPPKDFRKFRSCGAYRLKEWEAGKKIVLAPSKGFPGAHAKLPDLEFLFINEDSLALQAYQKGDLDFLRRLPTLFLKNWEGSPDLHKIDQTRFDYLAFSPEGLDRALARALAESIDYEAWRKLYSAKPRPGCFGIPAAWTGGPVCWNFDPDRARETLKKRRDPSKASTLTYSKQGGDDHDRTMEFLQSQWKTHLGLDVRIEAQENKIFLENLREKRLAFFRKGLSPERPGCLSVLENFAPDAGENYPGFHDAGFDKVLASLRKKDSVADCRRGVEILRDRGLLIPTGPIYFSLLAKPRWRGWKLNDLNHLDLSGLHLEPIK